MHTSRQHDQGRTRQLHQQGARGPEAVRPRVLVVDDDDAARDLLEQLLRADGYSIASAANGVDAIAEINRVRPDLVLTDLQMPEMAGTELCRRLRALDDPLPVIVMTGHSDMGSAVESMRAGAEDYLIKPLDYDAVAWCVERAIARHQAKRQQDELSRKLNERLVVSSIREQEHAEQESRQRAQLNTLLQNLTEGVAIADPSGRIVLMNAAAREILGVGERKLENLDDLHKLEAVDVRGRTLPVTQRPLMRALRGNEFKDYEVVRVQPSGERRNVLSTGTSVRDENGKVALAIVIFRDVTELRRLERHRDEYIALVSHDLRTPLSSIRICVSTLKLALPPKNAVPPALATSLAERTERNVVRMTAMLDELTESTSLESQPDSLVRKRCDLRALVAGVVESLDDERAHRITVTTDQPSVPYVVLGDAARLERVIANLITNALKYSDPDAPVTIRLLRRGDRIELEVVDQGIGIPPESTRQLFQRYYRAPGGKSRASGLGLGLYIARLIVEAHGGTIDVLSELGQGTTFRVSLPAEVESTTGTDAPSSH